MNGDTFNDVWELYHTGCFCDITGKKRDYTGHVIVSVYVAVALKAE